MPSPIITATIQSTFITFCSCLIAQFLNPDNPPHYVSLILYGILATPPNFLWQQFIEKHFPGYRLKKVEVDEGGSGVDVQKRLHVRNTVIKVILDQTLAAVPNTVAYIGITRWLRGLPLEMCWDAVKEHVFVPVEKKILMGNLVGMGRASADFDYRSYNLFRVKRLFSSKPIWLFFMAVALTLWWSNGGSEELDVVKLSATGLGKEFLKERRMYIGRWTATPNRLRKDGTFPGKLPERDLYIVFFTDEDAGVYFDIAVRNTTSLFIALHNAPEDVISASAASSAVSTKLPTGSAPSHLSFRPMPSNKKPAPPVSLLARIDDDEYVLLPNSSSLVSVCLESLVRDQEHHIRLVAPMVDDQGRGVVELEGLWLSKGGSLIKVAGSSLSEEYVDEDLLRAENDIVGEKHRAGLSELEKDGIRNQQDKDQDVAFIGQERKKTLEIVTDSPGSFTGKHRGRRTGGADGLLAGVMGWEYLLGEMFGADHVGVGVDGMCLTQDCIGGTGYPAGMGDVFFRSGPYGSEYFEHSWMFTGYIPDVLVLNVGSSDETSFHEHAEEYNKTMWELTEKFENTYVSLIKGIRRFGYPNHPAIVQSERLGSPGIIPNGAPASIPIFIMRPLRGQLEQATQATVAKLRADGDKFVFWLDTSGWLDLEDNLEESGDFFLDKTTIPARWRLTEQGNQRVAIFLHMHVCRYLAGEQDKCAFLPQEVYQGTVYDQEAAHLDRFLETEKEKKLKELFWGDGDDEEGNAKADTKDVEVD
ncbi:MAG: hypothetical protein Q9217_000239 [Psora testacea]